MWLRRLTAVLSLTLSASTFADVSQEVLLVEPRKIPDGVWRAVGYVHFSGPTSRQLRTYTRAADGTFAASGTVRLGDLKAISDSGYHPPEDPSYVNPSKYALLEIRRGYLRVVTDPERGRAVWFEEKELAGLPTWLREVFFSMKGGPTVQLLFLPGAEKVAVHAEPESPQPLRALTAAGQQWFDVVEVRGGWGRIKVHVNPLAGPSTGADGTRGWIRLRDAEGRLTVWPVNPDTC